MGAASKKARKVRESSEFNTARLTAAAQFPKDTHGSVFSWTLADIFTARDAQMRGQFWLPSMMAKSMRTDDACAVAYENRLAPQRCVEVELVPAGGARGKPIAAEANALFGQEGVGIHADTMADIVGCLVNHGVAFGYNTWSPREDGSRVDVETKFWPIEFVRWDPFRKSFIARLDFADPESGGIAKDAAAADRNQGPLGAFEVPITHGDGRWIIFKKHEIDPWCQEAAILAACLVWARHAYALKDWAKGSVAHGSAKIVGEMPGGVALTDENGKPTPDALAFLALLRDLVSGDTPAGIRPAGAKTEFVANNSTAWQVWNELVLNAEKAAARIYLGTDGTLGTQGGAPGVDIATLFGVATTKIEGDLKCIERGLATGVIEPWCAMNFGDSSLAPQRKYKIPDADKQKRADATAKRYAAFWANVQTAHDSGIVLDQAYICALAQAYDVIAPTLPPGGMLLSPSVAAAGDPKPKPMAA